MQAAIEQAVDPTVTTCVSKLLAMETDTAARILDLRQRVNNVVASFDPDRRDGIQKLANKLLHEPTIQLREGKLSDEDVNGVAQMIERKLRSDDEIESHVFTDGAL